MLQDRPTQATFYVSRLKLLSRRSTQTEIERGPDRISLNRPTLELIVSAWVQFLERGARPFLLHDSHNNKWPRRLHVANQLATWQNNRVGQIQ